MDGRSPQPPKAYVGMTVTASAGFVGLMFASDAGTYSIRLNPEAAEDLAEKLHANAGTARDSRRLAPRK